MAARLLLMICICTALCPTGDPEGSPRRKGKVGRAAAYLYLTHHELRASGPQGSSASARVHVSKEVMLHLLPYGHHDRLPPNPAPGPWPPCMRSAGLVRRGRACHNRKRHSPASVQRRYRRSPKPATRPARAACQHMDPPGAPAGRPWLCSPAAATINSLSYSM